MSTRTKSILIYMGGVITGIVLTIAFCIVIAIRQNSGTSSAEDDIVMFDNPTQEIKAKEFKIFQVLPNGSALASIEDYSSYGTVVMFLADEGTSFYDDQKIDVPTGKHVMQIGTFKYESRSELVKTVPIVQIR